MSFQRKPSKDNPGFRWPVLIIGLPILLLLAWGTWQRNAVWRDPIRLWRDTAEKSPQKSRPRINLGREYFLRGRRQPALANGWLDLALQEYQQAELLAMNEPEPTRTRAEMLASVNIADLFIHENRFNEAHEILKEAWLKHPHFSGLALNLSLYYLTRTPPEPEKAEVFLSDAIAHIADFPSSEWELGKLYFNRAVAEGFEGRCVAMKRDGWKARRFDPDLAVKDLHCFRN